MTTYYVDGVDGDDANAGTSEGSGNAWATIDKAMNTVAAGDKVWVKASGTYSETPNIDTAGTGWTDAGRIEFEGYTSTTGDGGKATIDGTTNGMTSSLSGATYYTFKNFILNGHSLSGVNMNNADVICWYNCEFSNNGSHGVICDNSHVFVKCVAANNGGDGFDADSGPFYIACKAYGNGNAQFYSLAQGLMYGCLGYAPTANYDIAGGFFAEVIGCTLDGDGTTGVDCIGGTTGTINLVVNNILYDGVNGAVSSSNFNLVWGWNLVNSLTRAYGDNASGAQTGALFGIGDVTSAPSFTDEANDDYTLATDSPARDAGLGVD